MKRFFGVQLLITITVTIAVTLNVYGQQIKLLTLEDAIAIALEESYQMKSLRLSLVKAEQSLIAAKGRYKTNANIGLDLPNWSESVSEVMGQNSLPVFNTTGSFRYQGVLNINQPIPTDGVLTLRSQVYHRDIFTYQADLSNNEKRKDLYSSLSINFRQPLFTVNQLKLGLKTAHLNYETTKLQYNKNQLDIIYSVAQSFYNLYKSTRNVQIAKDNYERQQELFDIARKKYDADLIPEVEVLQMEVDLIESKNKLIESEGALTRTEDNFKRLIGLKLSDRISVLTNFEFKKFDVDLDKATEMALANSVEIRRAEIDIELKKYDIKDIKSRGRIQGELSASYDLTGVSDVSWNETIHDLRDRPNNRSIVLRLSVPLWDGGVNSANVISAETGLEEQQMRLVEKKIDVILDVRNVVGRINETDNRLEVLEKNQAIAQRSFDISVQRFDLGDITSQELALDRDRLTQAKFSYLDAFIEYQLAIADLRRITMYDFK